MWPLPLARRLGAEKDALVFLGAIATPEELAPGYLAKSLYGASLGNQLVEALHQAGAAVSDRELGDPGGPEGFHKFVDRKSVV